MRRWRRFGISFDRSLEDPVGWARRLGRRHPPVWGEQLWIRAGAAPAGQVRGRIGALHSGARKEDARTRHRTALAGGLIDRSRKCGCDGHGLHLRSDAPCVPTATLMTDALALFKSCREAKIEKQRQQAHGTSDGTIRHSSIGGSTVRLAMRHVRLAFATAPMLLRMDRGFEHQAYHAVVRLGAVRTRLVASAQAASRMSNRATLPSRRRNTCATILSVKP